MISSQLWMIMTRFLLSSFASLTWSQLDMSWAHNSVISGPDISPFLDTSN
jgi:hypothetical protein